MKYLLIEAAFEYDDSNIFDDEFYSAFDGFNEVSFDSVKDVSRYVTKKAATYSLSTIAIILAPNGSRIDPKALVDSDALKMFKGRQVMRSSWLSSGPRSSYPKYRKFIPPTFIKDDPYWKRVWVRLERRRLYQLEKLNAKRRETDRRKKLREIERLKKELKKMEKTG